MNPTAPAENSAAVAAAQEELVAAECCVDARVFEDIHSLIMSPAAGGEDRDHSEPSSASSSSVLALDFADITAEDIRNFTAEVFEDSFSADGSVVGLTESSFEFPSSSPPLDTAAFDHIDLVPLDIDLSVSLGGLSKPSIKIPPSIAKSLAARKRAFFLKRQRKLGSPRHRATAKSSSPSRTSLASAISQLKQRLGQRKAACTSKLSLTV
jgi:hypothetical protein